MIDIFGCVVEVVSGMILDVFFCEWIFEFFGMIDIDFFVLESKLDCLMVCYVKNLVNGEVILSDGVG